MRTDPPPETRPGDDDAPADLVWLGLPADAIDVLATIWATVDLERTLATAGIDAALAGDAVDEPLLGARVVVAPATGAGGPRGPRVVFAEPSTEGRLAATLARHGEGPAGRYVAIPRAVDDTIARAVNARIAISRPSAGPFGRSVLVSGPDAGPHVILVEIPATLAAMTDPAAIALRPATLDDAERIASLFTDEGYPAGPTDIVERLGRFADDDARVIVAEHGGEVLGFVAMVAMPRFEHGDRILRIVALVVDPGVRERGIGRLLMAEAERIGRDVGAAFAEVTAGHHRADARRLYEEIGYDATVAAYLRKRL